MGESHFTKGAVQTAVEPSSPDKDRAVSQGRERKAVVSGISCPLAIPPALGAGGGGLLLFHPGNTGNARNTGSQG